MIVAEAARLWHQAGVSLIPVMQGGTKKPAIRWGEYQVHIPELGEVDRWWGNGHEYGLALICGAVSGNLEMTEIEGRAMSGDHLVMIENAMDEVGAGQLWDQLKTTGYMEMSPSGGIHFLYRISDHEVPGNEKIATIEDKDVPGGRLVLAETRGEGGYVIVAPTTGLCHPSGEAWVLLRGEVGEVPILTWQQRCALHRGLKLALDVAPVSTALDIAPRPAPPASNPPPQDRVPGGAGLSPNDDFEARTDWADILEPHGWRLESVRHGERFWTRPGKDPKLGASATTGAKADRDRLYVFSTSTVFNTEEPYTKYMAYAILNFGGDKRAATQDLVRRGFGEARERIIELNAEIDWPHSEATEPVHDNSDSGNAQYLHDRTVGRYVYMAPEGEFYAWDGRTWTLDLRGRLKQEYKAMCSEKQSRAAMRDDEKAVKRWTNARNAGKVDAALRMLRDEPGVTVLPSEMNRGTGLLNVANGILDLRKCELMPHDPEFRQTRMFGASFNPEAACPNFTAFMERALPDEGMRRYVQRALGYSLLGDADQRAMFLIYGPSGTGKSTLMETMRQLFADYGVTAPSNAFRDRSKEGNALTNDLHSLRGKRFVTTSETAEGANFNEDLLKRLTGRDSVQSRELYEKNQEWTPECTLWLATNHPPKFNSDDDAIWRRTKLIPFQTQFTGEGEIADMARRVLAPEADGILNWLLAGLADFLANGLGEPETVAEAARELRAESDSVVRFLDDQIADGGLDVGPGLKIRTRELYVMYQNWCSSSGERSLGTRRFAHRLESAGRGITCERYAGAASMFVGTGRDVSRHLWGRSLESSG